MNLKKIREQRKLYEAAEQAFTKAEALLDKIMNPKPRDPNWHDKGEHVTWYQTTSNGGMTCRRRVCVESGNPGEWKDLTVYNECGSS